MKKISNIFDTLVARLHMWANNHHLNLIVFNLLIVSLFLLRSAGYFYPFYVLSVNFIVIFALVVSIWLLKANSRSMFVVTLFFWIFAGFLKIIRIDVWAERTAIYAYESLTLGVTLLLVEVLNKRNVN